MTRGLTDARYGAEALYLKIEGSTASASVIEIGAFVLPSGTWDLSIDCVLKNNDAAAGNSAIYYAVKAGTGSATGGFSKVSFRESSGAPGMRVAGVANAAAQFTYAAASGYTYEHFENREYVTAGCTLAISLQNQVAKTLATDATVYINAKRR